MGRLGMGQYSYIFYTSRVRQNVKTANVVARIVKTEEKNTNTIQLISNLLNPKYLNQSNLFKFKI